MKFIFWIGIGWLAYVYAGYPFVVWLSGLVRPIHPAEELGVLPSVSVLISARNEEKDIGWKVRQTLDWDYPSDRLQVLVASDASHDRTDAILKDIHDPRFTFMRIPQRGGKNAALNHLFAMACGELLFFTDANSHIDEGCLRRMVRHFADPRVGCVTGVESPVQKTATSAISAGGATYLSYEAFLNTLESKIGSVLVCDGSIFCIRRSLFSELQPELANDLELPVRIGHRGYWLLFDATARSREYATQSSLEEFLRRRRICGQGALAMWRLRECLTGIRAWQFASRKLLRWLSLVPITMILVSSAALAANKWFRGVLALQVFLLALAARGWILARSGKKSPRVCSVPFYALLAYAGAIVGLMECAFGHRFHSWDIPRSSRGLDRTPASN